MPNTDWKKLALETVRNKMPKRYCHSCGEWSPSPLCGHVKEQGLTTEELEIAKAQALATWPIAFEAGLDEGIKRTSDAADSTYSAQLKAKVKEAEEATAREIFKEARLKFPKLGYAITGQLSSWLIDMESRYLKGEEE